MTDEHHAEQPEQWARELAHDIDGAASMFDDEFDHEAAALTIQSAFAAREADLVGAIEQALGQISGGLCYFSAEAKHEQLRDADKTLRAALKSREASHG